MHLLIKVAIIRTVIGILIWNLLTELSVMDHWLSYVILSLVLVAMSLTEEK